MSEETSFYSDDRGVRVTDKRVVIGNTTYSLADVTSVSTRVEKPRFLGPAVFMLVGVIVILASLKAKPSIGDIFLGLVITGIGYGSYRRRKTVYHLRIGSASGESTPLNSVRRDWIEGIARAINEARMRRETQQAKEVVNQSAALSRPGEGSDKQREEETRKREAEELSRRREEEARQTLEKQRGIYGLTRIVGQRRTVERIKSFAQLYAKAGTPLGHILLTGPDGCGKRTMARAIAFQFCQNLKLTEPPGKRNRLVDPASVYKPFGEPFGLSVQDAAYFEKRGDLTAILTNLDQNQFLVVPHLGNLRKSLAEILHAALSKFVTTLIIGQGPGARIHPFRLNPFTCIATATTETECPRELMEAFPLRIALEPYSGAEIAHITAAIFAAKGRTIQPSLIPRVARLASGSPHEAELLVEHVVSTGGETITEEHLASVLAILGLDSQGSSSSGPAKSLGDLTGVEFEKLIGTLLQRMGFRVQLTQPTGDGGIDIVANLNRAILGGKYLIQCKRFSPDSVVGAPTVREFYGALIADRQAVKGILITTSTFSTQARDFASNLPLELIDGGQLQQLLAEHGLSD